MDLITAEEKEIDGIRFRYTPLMLKQSRATFDELAQRFGPAIAAAVEGLGAAELNADMEIAQVLGSVTDSAGALLRGFVGGLDPAYHAKLADALAKQTEFVNDKGNWLPLGDNIRELMFGARLLTETKLIWWCLSVQYSDFLAPLAKLGQQAIALRGMATSASGSPKASTGSSIASPSVTSTPTA